MYSEIYKTNNKLSNFQEEIEKVYLYTFPYLRNDQSWVRPFA